MTDRFYAFLTTRALDAAIALVFGVVMAATAVVALQASNIAYFFQTFTPEVVYHACGFGYVHPGNVPPALQDFLTGKVATFSCDTLPPPGSVNPPGLFFGIQIYLSKAVGFLWAQSGVSYVGLWPLLAALACAYGAGGYLLVRLFFCRLWAIIGGLLISASPVALSLAISLRDFSKAPFMIWALILALLCARASSRRGAILWGALAGLVVGISIGFRVDLLLLYAVIPVALAAATSRETLLRRASGALAFVAVALVSGWPILSNLGQSSGGSLIMQGLSDPYERFLELAPAPYSFGAAYSDELTLSSIAAAERPRIPDWDANEPKPVYGISQAMQLSGRNVMRWLPWFSGDVATQGLKAVGWIVAYPAFVAPGRAVDPAFWGLTNIGLAGLLTPLYGLIAGWWLVPITLAGAVLFFWREAAIRPAAVLTTFLLFFLVVASVIVQPAVRHVFHLEFVWVLSLLALPASLQARGALRATARRYVPALLVLITAGAVAYAALLYHQQRSLRSVFAALLDLPREKLREARLDGVPENTLRLDVPIPANRQAIVASAPDSMTPDIPLRALQWDVRAEADRMALTFSSCPEGDYAIKVVYARTDLTWQPFDYDIPLRLEETGSATVVFPAFYRPTQHFEAVEIVPASAGCDVVLERIVGDSDLPPALTVVLTDGWQERRLFRGLGWF